MFGLWGLAPAGAVRAVEAKWGASEMAAKCLQCLCFAAQKEEEQKIKDYRRSNLTRRLSQFNFNDEEGMAAAAMFVRSGAKLKFQNEFREGFASNLLENGDLTTRNDDPCQSRPSHRSHQYLWHVTHLASEEHPREQEDAETGADDNVSPTLCPAASPCTVERRPQRGRRKPISQCQCLLRSALQPNQSLVLLEGQAVLEGRLLRRDEPRPRANLDQRVELPQ